MADSVGEGVGLCLLAISNKTDYPSRLLQEVTHLGMYACIIFYILLSQDVVTFVCHCTPYLEFNRLIHEYDLI
jgi:hypothetical protein